MENEFGKFKDEEGLVKGYESLEKEFTKKCQELSDAKKRISELEGIKASYSSDTYVGETPEITQTLNEGEQNYNSEEVVEEPVVEENSATSIKEKPENSQFGVDFRARVVKFLSSNPDAKGYIKDISKILLSEKGLMNTSDPLMTAYLIAKGKAPKEVIVEEKQAPKEEVKKAQKVYPRVLGDVYATSFGVGTSKKYSSFEDARNDLLTKYFG